MDGQTSRQTDRLDVGKQDDKPNESMIIGFVDNWRVELFPLGVFVRWFSLRHSSLEGSAHARDDISRCFHDLYVRTRANLRTRMRMTRRNAIYFLVSLNKKKKKQPRETGNERVAQRRVKKKKFPPTTRRSNLPGTHRKQLRERGSGCCLLREVFVWFLLRQVSNGVGR